MPLKTVLKNFLNHLETLEARRKLGDDLYEVEFQNLKELTERLKHDHNYACTQGEMDVNRRKNRYKDILPYDHTRVTLSDYPGVPGSDYINANYIKGASGSMAYIASQGPLPNTVVDFWRMIWECEVKVVVMACNERESGKYKCECYWPSDGEKKQAGNITIELVKWRQVCPDFLLRTLKVRNGNEERPICQFHYASWPDHGVPTSVQPILELVRLVRDCQASEAVPVLVHCSAGCGRTGTICAIDYVWGLMRMGKLSESFSLYQLISEMRRQRIAMVQTKEQYILVHRAVGALFEQQLRVIDNHTYENIDEDGEPLIWKEIERSGDSYGENRVEESPCKEKAEKEKICSDTGEKEEKIEKLQSQEMQEKALFSSQEFILSRPSSCVQDMQGSGDQVDSCCVLPVEERSSEIISNTQLPIKCMTKSLTEGESPEKQNIKILEIEDEKQILTTSHDTLVLNKLRREASVKRLISGWNKASVESEGSSSGGQDQKNGDCEEQEVFHSSEKKHQTLGNGLSCRKDGILNENSSSRVSKKRPLIKVRSFSASEVEGDHSSSPPPDSLGGPTRRTVEENSYFSPNLLSRSSFETERLKKPHNSERLVGKATVIRRPSIAHLKALFEKSVASENDASQDHLSRRQRPLSRSHSHHIPQGRMEENSEGHIGSNILGEQERTDNALGIVSRCYREPVFSVHDQDTCDTRDRRSIWYNSSSFSNQENSKDTVNQSQKVGQTTNLTDFAVDEPQELNNNPLPSRQTKWYTQENATPDIKNEENKNLSFKKFTSKIQIKEPQSDQSVLDKLNCFHPKCQRLLSWDEGGYQDCYAAKSRWYDNLSPVSGTLSEQWHKQSQVHESSNVVSQNFLSELNHPVDAVVKDQNPPELPVKRKIAMKTKTLPVSECHYGILYDNVKKKTSPISSVSQSFGVTSISNTKNSSHIPALTDKCEYSQSPVFENSHERPPELPEKKVIGKQKHVKNHLEVKSVTTPPSDFVLLRKTKPVSETVKSEPKEPDVCIKNAYTTQIQPVFLKTGQQQPLAKSNKTKNVNLYSNVNLAAKKNIETIENTLEQHHRGAIIDLMSKSSCQLERQHNDQKQKKIDVFTQKDAANVSLPNRKITEDANILPRQPQQQNKNSHNHNLGKMKYEPIWIDGSNQVTSSADQTKLHTYQNTVTVEGALDKSNIQYKKETFLKKEDVRIKVKDSQGEARNLLLHSPAPKSKKSHDLTCKPTASTTKNCSVNKKEDVVTSDKEQTQTSHSSSTDVSELNSLLDELTSHASKDFKRESTPPFCEISLPSASPAQKQSFGLSYSQAYQERQKQPTSPSKPHPVSLYEGVTTEIISEPQGKGTIHHNQAHLSNKTKDENQKNQCKTKAQRGTESDSSTKRKKDPDYECIYPLQHSFSSPQFPNIHHLHADNYKTYEPRIKPQLHTSILSKKCLDSNETSNPKCSSNKTSSKITPSCNTGPPKPPRTYNHSSLNQSSSSPYKLDGGRLLVSVGSPKNPALHKKEMWKLPVKEKLAHHLKGKKALLSVSDNFSSGGITHHVDSKRIRPFNENALNSAIPAYGKELTMPVYSRGPLNLYACPTTRSSGALVPDYENVYNSTNSSQIAKSGDHASKSSTPSMHALRHSISDASVYVTLRGTKPCPQGLSVSRTQGPPIYSQVVKLKKNESQEKAVPNVTQASPSEGIHRRSQDDMDLQPVAPPRNRKQLPARRSMVEVESSGIGWSVKDDSPPTSNANDQEDSNGFHKDSVDCVASQSYHLKEGSSQACTKKRSDNSGVSDLGTYGKLGDTISKALGKLTMGKLSKLRPKPDPGVAHGQKNKDDESKSREGTPTRKTEVNLNTVDDQKQKNLPREQWTQV
ncbi:uncharacterized protein LOC106463400 isoform X1 [Limulus polyphemus]|uniref:protein-tyrosine-phosphatase n=1 Tax=Limulus polyphemus TaxID=6850 RepID=A0ABM1SSI1_LIMPO|nr:uncharacterized protein LOC106463400 isoform X1 [Limulus polyphemus]